MSSQNLFYVILYWKFMKFCHYKFNFMSYINISCPSKQLT